MQGPQVFSHCFARCADCGKAGFVPFLWYVCQGQQLTRYAGLHAKALHVNMIPWARTDSQVPVRSCHRPKPSSRLTPIAGTSSASASPRAAETEDPDSSEVARTDTYSYRVKVLPIGSAIPQQFFQNRKKLLRMASRHVLMEIVKDHRA